MVPFERTLDLLPSVRYFLSNLRHVDSLLDAGEDHGSDMSVEHYGARLLGEVQEESLDEVSNGNLSAHSLSSQPCPPKSTTDKNHS